jgi:hypothetical protein
MHLEGSCHCGAVRFSLEAYGPVPYLRCYCSICRKTGGGGGFAINLGGRADKELLESNSMELIFLHLQSLGNLRSLASRIPKEHGAADLPDVDIPDLE